MAWEPLSLRWSTAGLLRLSLGSLQPDLKGGWRWRSCRLFCFLLWGVSLRLLHFSISVISLFQKDSSILHLCCFALWRLYEYVLFKQLKKEIPPISSLSLRRLLCYSPKNWFRLFKGLFFTALSPRVDARQAALIFSEFEVIVLNWQTKHLFLLVFHFYH